MQKKALRYDRRPFLSLMVAMDALKVEDLEIRSVARRCGSEMRWQGKKTFKPFCWPTGSSVLSGCAFVTAGAGAATSLADS